MKSFQDIHKRAWNVEVTVSTIKRVRGLVGVDLLDVLGGKLIDRLSIDPILLADVLYAVCKPQADELKITDEQFGHALAGDAIEHATVALLDELVSFCPSPRDRANLGRVLAKTREAMDKARDVLDARIESGELDREIDKALQPILRPTPGPSSGGSPASPALTLTP